MDNQIKIEEWKKEFETKFSDDNPINLPPNSNSVVKAVACWEIEEFISTLLKSQRDSRDKELVEKIKQISICKVCGGEGVEIIGENKVTLDMAIDAGDRSMEGMHHSFEYAQCPNCNGSGIEPNIVVNILSLLKEDIK